MKARYISLAMAIIVFFSMAMPVQAASKKPVYVCVSMSALLYDDEVGDIDAKMKYKYKKDGLLKSGSSSLWGGFYTSKYSYKYGKKNRIKQKKCTDYLLGEKYSKSSAKYTYSRKGYVAKVVEYNGKGKKTSIKKYSFNAKGSCVKAREYDGKGKLKQTIKYTRNKKGKVLKEKAYNNKGKLKYTEKYTWSKRKAVAKKYNAKGKLIETTVTKFNKQGNIVSVATYDDKNGHKKILTAKYKYKRIVTKKHSAVKKQQRNLMEFL